MQTYERAESFAPKGGLSPAFMPATYWGVVQHVNMRFIVSSKAFSYLSIYIFAFLSISLSIYLYIYSIYLYIYLSIYVRVCELY